LREVDEVVSKPAVGRVRCPGWGEVREVTGLALGTQLFIEELGVTTVQLAWVVAFGGPVVEVAAALFRRARLRVAPFATT
jgi:hypothetical protein